MTKKARARDARHCDGAAHAARRDARQGPSAAGRPTRRPRSALVARAARRGDLGATLAVARAARRGGGAARRPPPGRRRRRAGARGVPLGGLAPRPCLRRPRCPHLHVGPDVSRAVDATARSTVRPRGRPRARRLPRRGGGRRRAPPRPSKQPAAPRDLSVPFDAARGSRLHHRGRERAHAARAVPRPDLDLLRDYEARRDAVASALPAKRTTPSSSAGGRRGAARGKRETPFPRPRVPVRRAVPPEHVGWFARVSGYPHGRGRDGGAPMTRRTTRRAGLASGNGAGRSGFALFVAAPTRAFSDSLREVLVAT